WKAGRVERPGTKKAAWRRAPGSSEAEGRPREATLRPVCSATGARDSQAALSFVKRRVHDPGRGRACRSRSQPRAPLQMQAHPEDPIDPGSTPIRWRFGAFLLLEDQRRLERAGERVRLGSRAFDLLLSLVRRAGEFVGKDELLSAVWKGVVVEEGSVRVHMSMLRKALGTPDDGEDCSEWISTVALRGYRFNGRVRREPIGATAQESATPAHAALPTRFTALIGRETDVDTVLALLAEHRLVTIVGAGGIGKTTLAIRSAEIHRE